jgi:hypothetical protein
MLVWAAVVLSFSCCSLERFKTELDSSSHFNKVSLLTFNAPYHFYGVRGPRYQ